MIAMAVARHLAAKVDGLTFDADDPGGNVYVAFMPDKPDTAVAVMPAGGQAQPSKIPNDLPGLQVIVRGERHTPRDSFELARAIYSELTCLDLTTLDPNGDDEVFVVSCTATQSDPVPMGQDANQRHEWSLNFQLRTTAVTTHRGAA